MGSGSVFFIMCQLDCIASYVIMLTILLCTTLLIKTKIFWYQSQKSQLIGTGTKIFSCISQNTIWMIIKIFWNYPKYFDQPKDFFGGLFYFGADTKIFLALARLVLEDIVFWEIRLNILVPVPMNCDFWDWNQNILVLINSVCPQRSLKLLTLELSYFHL